MTIQEKDSKTFFYNEVITKKYLKDIIFWVFQTFGMEQAGYLSDCLKTLGFYYSTQGGLSLSIEDLKVPPIKSELIDKANIEITKTEIECNSGILTSSEKYLQIIENWNLVSENLKNNLVSYFKRFDPLNPIYMMAFSGARGNLSQVRQLIGMRGLMADSNGEMIDIPIIKNFREGLTVTDYMISAYGARKGLVDTSLRTADSGYLTRRLVDVAQDVLIREIDCKSTKSILLFSLKNSDSLIISLKDRLIGRTLAINLFDPISKVKIANKNELITPFLASKIEKLKISQVNVRSPLTCELNRSVCQKCYGLNLAYLRSVDLGEAIGIISAQSIGEPGTQLTMRTFHTGGVFNAVLNRQIYAKTSGQVYLPKNLRIIPKRTNKGNFFYSLEVGINIKILDFKNKVSKINFAQNTNLFIKNKEFIKKGQVIAELNSLQKKKVNNNEKKKIQVNFSGELYFGTSKNEIISNENKEKNILIWILSGKVFQIPIYFKIVQKKGYRFRLFDSIAKTKLITSESGKIIINGITNKKLNVNNFSTKLLIKKICLKNTNIFKVFDHKSNFLTSNKNNTKIIFKQNNEYFIVSKQKEENNLKLLTLGYKTKTGGHIYFTQTKLDMNKQLESNFELFYGGGVLFLPQETLLSNKDKSRVVLKSNTLVESKTKIRRIISNINFGLAEITKTKKSIKQIIIKTGSYILLKNKNKTQSHQFNKKIFYPGELLFDVFSINQITYTEVIQIKDQAILFLRPITLYEIPKATEKHTGLLSKSIISQFHHNSDIESSEPINLFEVNLDLSRKLIKSPNLKNLASQFSISKNKDSSFNLNCNFSKTIFPSKAILHDIDFKNLYITPLVKTNQYVEAYTVISKFEIVSNSQLNVKSLNEKNYKKSRRVLLISDNDLKTIFIENKNFTNKKTNFILAGHPIAKNLIALNSGKVVENTGIKLTIHLSKPFLISKLTRVLWSPNDFIKGHENLGFLFYEKARTGDIVQGLPKIEEILEARKPKTEVKYFRTSGIFFQPTNQSRTLQFVFINRETINLLGVTGELENNILSYTSFIQCGEPINFPFGNPHIILNSYNQHYKEFFKYGLYNSAYRSLRKIQSYLLNKIQSIYYLQGVTIADKHLEVIIKQMTSKVIITNRGDTSILLGELVELNQIKIINRVLRKTKCRNLFYRPILLGITKASLMTESFISGASFQETVRVLTAASIEGKVDWLQGLKENVIVGSFIPAGTGFNTSSHISDLSFRVLTNKNTKQKNNSEKKSKKSKSKIS